MVKLATFSIIAALNFYLVLLNFKNTARTNANSNFPDSIFVLSQLNICP